MKLFHTILEGEVRKMCVRDTRILKEKEWDSLCAPGEWRKSQQA
jgi:hypothetical protein